VSDDVVDFSEVLQLAADFGAVPAHAGPLVNSAMQVTAVKVKKSAQDKVAGGSKRWSALPNSIDYDIKLGDSGSGDKIGAIAAGLAHGVTGAAADSITAEVGYNKSRGGGPLGNIREFGAPRKDTPPHNDLANALEENQDDFFRGQEIAIADAEGKSRL
jgi:hypothetical protein